MTVQEATRVTIVRGSIEFRDAVMALAREGLEVFVSREGFSAPIYQVVYRSNPAISLNDFFDGNPPVHMEDFATALAPFGTDAPPMAVFTFQDV